MEKGVQASMWAKATGVQEQIHPAPVYSSILEVETIVAPTGEDCAGGKASFPFR